MMEETYLVEHIKEAVCFVSTDLKADLAASRAGKHKLEYVLPDGVNDQLGHVREPLPKAAARDKANKEQVCCYWLHIWSRARTLSMSITVTLENKHCCTFNSCCNAHDVHH